MVSYFKKRSTQHKRGFTLIEILIVIGILAILAAIVIIAINPAKQFAQARNTQRQSGVTTILNAIGQRMADNEGIFQGAFTAQGVTYTCGVLPVTATSTITGTMAADTVSETGSLGCLVPTYIASLPADPNAPANTYAIKVQQNGRVMVCADGGAEPSVPGSGPICVIR